MDVMRKAGLAAAVAAAVLASGCSRIQNNQGFVVDEQLVAAIQPGVDNRDSVAKTLGRPSFEGQFGDKSWYYVSRNTAQVAFLSPRPTSQSILAVTFDDKGVVSRVERKGLDQVVDVRPYGGKTPTLGRETGILQDLFGNIGRFGGAPAGGGPPQ